MLIESYDMLDVRKYLTNPLVGVGVGVAATLFSILFPLYLYNRPPSRRRSPPALTVIPASKRPAIAIQEAAKHIALGKIATLGELVFFLRGNQPRHIVVDDIVRAHLVRLTGSGPFPGVDPMLSEHMSPRLAPMLRGLLRCTEQAARLEAERATPFDSENAAHMQLLRELWDAAGKPPEDFAQRSKEWNSMGFQGLDPTTDLRGGGVLALRQMAHFAKTHSAEFHSMMEYNRKVLAAGEDCWYLLAVVSIRFTAEILLREYDFCLPQLETLYDTVSYSNPRGRAKKAIAERNGDACALEAVWAQESDFEEGFFALHHQLLLHFRKCWHRDRPYVMDYGTYIRTVLNSFFTPDE